ncbi:MAG: hypothetical protein J3K34DRAFT_239529 [Monoraphidium minutum]|nr:MAG: hypothetical protein J3K34DRAFT_239529 [Monoraphidium minutum]
MDWWTLFAWTGLVGFIAYNWLLQQQQAQQAQRTHRQQVVQRAQEAAAAARVAPVQAGKKGKGKKGKSDAPKGMGASLDDRAGPSSPEAGLHEALSDQL